MFNGDGDGGGGNGFDHDDLAAAADIDSMPEVPPRPFLDRSWLLECVLPCVDKEHGVVAVNVIGSEGAIEQVNALFAECFPNHAALATEDDNVVFFGMMMQYAPPPTAAELFEHMARSPFLPLLPDVMNILLQTPAHFANRVGWMSSAELSATVAARSTTKSRGATAGSAK